jgi:glutamate carboxypeptidase
MSFEAVARYLPAARRALVRLVRFESPTASSEHVNAALRACAEELPKAPPDGAPNSLSRRSVQRVVLSSSSAPGNTPAVAGDALFVRYDFGVRNAGHGGAGSPLVNEIAESRVLAELEEKKGGADRPVVLLGHLDTVHPVGDGLRQNPLRFSSQSTGVAACHVPPALADALGAVQEGERSSLAETTPQELLGLVGDEDGDAELAASLAAHLHAGPHNDCVLHGPGTADMKGGIVAALAAIEMILSSEQRVSPRRRPIWLLLTPDEETGSRHSRALVEAAAKSAEAIFVLEPARIPTGEVKTARKGCFDFRVRVRGRSSHAGNAPFEGQNAVVELARLVGRMDTWSSDSTGDGTSVSVTRVSGGSANNVIPDLAEAYVDCRTTSLVEENRIRALLDAEVAAFASRGGAVLEVAPGDNLRPPMENGGAVMRDLFVRCSAAAERAGLPALREAPRVGGGSDANFTVRFAPTIDGLGPLGTGLHATDESVSLFSVVARARLLAALLEEWA